MTRARSSASRPSSRRAFLASGKEVARVEKRWSGLFNEVFTDKDNFRVTYLEALTPNERALVLAASLFIDLQYFEREASQ